MSTEYALVLIFAILLNIYILYSIVAAGVREGLRTFYLNNRESIRKDIVASIKEADKAL